MRVWTRKCEPLRNPEVALTPPDTAGQALAATRECILDAAEKYFRHIGHHKTTVADIASAVGMSRGNIYRFFPSKDAIDSAICARLVNETVQMALEIALKNTAASERLVEILHALHQHRKEILMQARPMHELLVSAMDESWAIMKTHVQKLVDIFEAVIREGLEMSELQPQDAAGSAQAMMAAFMPFFHPVLVEQCVRHDCNTEPALQAQINFIMKALGRPDRAA
jgi:AcrR family transcriptional regulator